MCSMNKALKNDKLKYIYKLPVIAGLKELL